MPNTYRLPDFDMMARCAHSQEPPEPLDDDETRCQACSERVLKVATKAMDNGDVFCLECASEVEA